MTPIISLVTVVLSLAAFLSVSDVPRPESVATGRLMVVTVDDLPVAQPSWHSDAQMDRISSELVGTLTRHGVPAVGFVNENKLEVGGETDGFRVGLLKRWLAAGLELGNHGYAHLDLHGVPPQEWMDDVLRGETVTRRLVEGSGGRLRYFRHPFLHTGTSVGTQRETAAFLRAHGYTVAPVTVDNGEWIYGRAYRSAFNTDDRELMERIGRDYLRYMLEVVVYYEGQSELIVGRAIPQVLLIHAYALNAHWLDELLAALEARGYRWATLEQALQDPVYERPVDGYTGPGGITWLHRWAITEGRDRSIFQGEPEPPEWVAGIGR